MPFSLLVSQPARKWIVDNGGYSAEYGARELKRILQRNIIFPLASLIVAGEFTPCARVSVEKGGAALSVKFIEAREDEIAA